MAVTTEVSEKLRALPEAAAVSVRMKAEHYFDVIRAMLDVFATKKSLDAIYVTSTIPSTSIINALDVLENHLDYCWYVDCISQIMMSAGQKHGHAIYVESTTMLENIMLKVEYLIRRTAHRKNLVIIDSINSLAIHNNTKILSEFLHILVNHLRSRGAYTVIFSMREYETDEIRNMLVLVSDDSIELGK